MGQGLMFTQKYGEGGVEGPDKKTAVCQSLETKLSIHVKDPCQWKPLLFPPCISLHQLSNLDLIPEEDIVKYINSGEITVRLFCRLCWNSSGDNWHQKNMCFFFNEPSYGL